MESPNETNPPPPPPCPSLFLSLPKKIVMNILARISKSYYQTLSLVSKSFRTLILSDELDMMRSYMGSFIAPQRFFTTFQPVLPVTLRQTNEELRKLQATTDSDSSSVKGFVNDIALDPLDQPQIPGSDSYDPWSNVVYNQSTPDDVLDQAPIKAVSGLVVAPQSFFTTFSPFPISLGQTNGGFEFEALTTTNNFKQYELWGPQENNNQTANTVDGLFDPPQENNNQRDANTIDGSFYMISRKPFDPIGRPYNPFGPIARPVTP